MARTGVVLFTRDLRLYDHPSLELAELECDRIVRLFVVDEALMAQSAKRAAFVRDRLDEIGIEVRSGDYVAEVGRFSPDTVYLAEDVTAYARRRERRLREAFDVRTAGGITIVPPGELAPKGKDHYRVFSAYWRAWRALPLPEGPPHPGRLPRPLSPHLHIGSVSPAAVARAADEELLRKLCWRDFFAQLHAVHGTRDLRRRAWVEDAAGAAAWREGRTGFPYVDAAMRELAATGWIDNRRRMVVASFLTKLMGVDWRVGAAHFTEHLVDGDVASNSGNWQWVAGTGSDTRPNRWFNPNRRDYDERWLAPDRPEPILDYAAAVERLRSART